MDKQRNKPETIQFFTTAGCHLCDQAEDLCQSFVAQGLITIETIDIAEDEQLVKLYGIRIPVLKRMDTAIELGWPFDKAGLSDYLSL